jgi:uncharacterized protein (TIGR02231 family)
VPEISTRIEEVTVYTDRARVTRRGRITLPTGPQEVALDDLPSELIPETVRAKARGSVPARLLGTDVTRTFHAGPPEARPAALQAQIEALQDQDETLRTQIDALTKRRVFLETLAASAGPELARGIALGRATVEAGAAVGVFLSEEFAEVDAELQRIGRERRDLGNELDARKAELQNLRRQRPTERQLIVVSMELDGEGEVDLEVSYQVPQASWQPLYDVRLTETVDSPRLSVASQAQVTQRTGEPWEHVALTLSTAKPALSAVLPELKPWYLRPYSQPYRPPAAAMRLAAPVAPAGAPALLPEEDLEAADAAGGFKPMEAVEQVARVEESGVTVTFRVPGRTGIPGDGSPHKVTLGNHDFSARLDYVTAPKLVTQAYRRARAINESDALLLPGPAQIFHEDEYVGSTSLKTIAPGQEFEVYLGVDDRIKVERKLVEGSVDKKLLVQVRRLTYAYEIQVTNLKSGRETVTLFDQVPVPRHESVKVRRHEGRPAPVEETELGRLKWEISLDPGQAKTVQFGFTIESPREMELAGLPPLEE